MCYNEQKSNLRLFTRPSFLSLDIICYLRFDICFLRFIIVGLQQVAGKTVPESMGGCAFRYFCIPDCPFNCFLDMGLMEIITSVFIFVRNECQRLCRKKPLPGEFPGGFFIFSQSCLEERRRHTLI